MPGKTFPMSYVEHCSVAVQTDVEPEQTNSRKRKSPEDDSGEELVATKKLILAQFANFKEATVAEFSSFKVATVGEITSTRREIEGLRTMIGNIQSFMETSLSKARGLKGSTSHIFFIFEIPCYGRKLRFSSLYQLSTLNVSSAPSATSPVESFDPPAESTRVTNQERLESMLSGNSLKRTLKRTHEKTTRQCVF